MAVHIKVARSLVSDWQTQLNKFPLDDLSEAYQAVRGFEQAVVKFNYACGDIGNDLAYDMIDEAFHLEEAAEEASHDIDQMVSAGLADPGNEVCVQRKLEAITDALQDALDAFAQEVDRA